MSRSDDDHIEHGPAMTPEFDEIESFQRTKAKSGLSDSLGAVPNTIGSTGGSSKTWLLMMAVLILLLVAWAGFLHMQLQATTQTLQNYETRVADLEQRLMVTDESVNESGVAMQVKIRELDSEIRKLWDNVWKKSKETFAEHEALLNKQQESIKLNQKTAESLKLQMSKNDVVIASLNEQLDKTKGMSKQLDTSQQTLLKLQRNLEATADKANKTAADIVKIERRVKGTEEWVESINGFRRQVNRDVDSLKQSVVQLQARP